MFAHPNLQIHSIFIKVTDENGKRQDKSKDIAILFIGQLIKINEKSCIYSDSKCNYYTTLALNPEKNIAFLLNSRSVLCFKVFNSSSKII